MNDAHATFANTGSTGNATLAGFDRLEAVQMALRVLTRLTGMRVALVARMTSEAWTACAVLDEAEFGLKPGDQLESRTTY